MDALEQIAARFAALAPACDYWTLRLVEESSEHLEVRQGVVEPSALGESLGAMFTVVAGGGVGYGATSDLSAAGLRAAAAAALGWAAAHAELGLFAGTIYPRSALRADYRSPVAEPWDSIGLADKLALLQDANTALAIDERIVDWSAWLAWRRVRQLLLTSDGGRIDQLWEYVSPGLAAVANAGSQTQHRHGGGADWSQQGGLERITAVGLLADAPRVAAEAIALLEAPECPSDTRDLILTPSQMVLQIHESIGHPLELDRILGDERNYAGTSFVTAQMFGTYRYGSDLLNVTFDPGVPSELVSGAADDDGTATRREFLIRNGLLERPLGGRLSQARSGLGGTANARACAWDRPPIDRMANVNLEPGQGSLNDLIARVERGVLMDTNRSWSIDDSRNKFQFGCEWGRLIEDGTLKGLVRNPGYRGLSADFWRSLDGVGGADTREVRGVQNCGKGEPNQAVYVGHATPPGLFRNVDVFGGGE
ncbi:TldD/PmbA family protein [Candidatus Thiodictyon syntrophicum]|jgi:predicted Zn-dependent protease|uniref:Peptidase C69 n=1 Tax=Candidatus Thiodictyon syntrophicum TaxID=1166950 RepID=A0A2K8U9Z3_9GAMM|nr:TldD/PmbA family protein [Candidatus Thiodictyon syntrophicum]AUB81871.1 peptidase C69 [Candidatus Thiodictyon syntrophicum]